MKTTLRIIDQVNVKFLDLDPHTRRKMVESLKFFLPHARHTPAFKLGRWDGTTSFAAVSGATYMNLLDRVLPIVMDAGYEIEIEDLRPEIKFEFPVCHEGIVADRKWPKGHPAEGEPIMLRDYQVKAINAFLENNQALQEISTGAGKCQPLHSKVLTPNGWTTMGEIKVGDFVTTPDGSPSRVLGVFEPGIKDTYRITFEDGRTVECCGDHIWRVSNVEWKNSRNPWRDLTTNELIALKAKSKRVIGVPLVTMEKDSDTSELPLDPWLLGFLLGDGCFVHGLGFSSADSEMVKRVSECLHQDYIVNHKSNYDYHINFKTKELKDHARSKHFNNGIGEVKDKREYFHFYKQELNRLGLLGKLSHEKFIPEEYLSGSRAQRLAILQGLIDSDGYVEKKGIASFTSTSEQLAKDVMYLVRSLGGVSKIITRPEGFYKNGRGELRPAKASYTVTIRYRNTSELMTLPRKKERAANYQNHKLDVLAITSIEPIGKQEVRCIYIDNPDHLYITDDFVVTHNTLLTATMSLMCEPYGRTIVIVPSKSLVVQTEEDYKNLGLDTGVFFGERKEWGKTHTICTWQSLSALMKKGAGDMFDEGPTLADFLDGVVAVIVDEVHSAKGNDLKTMLTGPLAHIPIRWGVTGTIPKDEVDQLSILIGLGPVVGKVTASELQEKGVLAQCHVNIVQLVDDHVEFKSYAEEKDYLTSDTTRLEWMADLTKKLAEEGNTLVLIDRIETGHQLQALIPDSVFINGGVKNSKRKEEYDDVQSANNKVIIATYGVAAVGINIPRIFNLVLIEPGKSFVRVIQSIGRGIRKAKDKDYVDIWDVTSTLKFSARHLTKRTAFYRDANYPFTKEKVDYRKK